MSDFATLGVCFALAASFFLLGLIVGALCDSKGNQDKECKLDALDFRVSELEYSEKKRREREWARELLRQEENKRRNSGGTE